MMNASLIIPTYNKLPRLKLLLASLKAQTCSFEKFEVIIINDQSTDGTKEYLETLKTDFLVLSLNSIVLPLDSHIESKKLENLKETLNNPKVLNNEVYKIHYEKTFLVDRCRILVDEKKAGILHCTSGSTSRPKLCYRTLAALTAEGRSFKELLYITEKDKILGLPPLYHSFALGAALMSSIVSGASLILIPQFKPRQALEVIIDEKVSIVVLVPIMAKVISNLADKKNEKYDSLRVALCGAGAVNQELYDTFKSAFGVNLMCNYGSTETGGIISRVSNEYIERMNNGQFNTTGNKM